MRFFTKKEKPAFQGDLSVVTIENLMQMVSHAALSGELQLTTSGNSAVFFVHQGALVYGYLEKNPLRIGERLIKEKYITSEQLQEGLDHYRAANHPPKIGKILVEKGYLQQEDLEKAIKDHIKSIFFETLSWKKGSFAFSIKEIPSSEDICLEERIDHLILEGIIHLDTFS